jgi:UTP--glucose-1-phosphate uridylyltransferase
MDDSFDPRTQSLLDVYRFNKKRFAAQCELLQKTPFSPALAHIAGKLKPLEADKYVRVDAKQPRLEGWRRRGEEALKKGEVAFVLLNGGMATRFGGVAKGAAKALGERSFLSLRMQQVKQIADQLHTKIPCVLMNSFATHEATRDHLKAHNNFGFEKGDLYQVTQGISVRLTENGEIFKDEKGEPSLYAPGHGDLPWAMAVNGVASQLHKRGVKVVFVSNVDNLGCTLDTGCIGAHFDSGKMLSIETIDVSANDVGGAPLYVDNRLQLVEGFRYPPSFNPKQTTGFNANSFYFSWPALDPTVALGFYPVAKKVGEQTAVQFERILGEVSKFVPTNYLRVPRDPETGRFLPVKTPEDLAALQPVLTKRYGG